MKADDLALASFLQNIGQFQCWSEKKAHYEASILAAKFVLEYTGRNDLAELVGNCQKADSRDELILLAADCLARGEKVTPQSFRDDELIYLKSVFDDKMYFPIIRRTDMATGNNNNFNPISDRYIEVTEYNQFWGKLELDARTIKDSRGVFTCAETWRELIRQYTCRIPAAVGSANDTQYGTSSFYEQAQLRAAFAHILASSSLERGDLINLLAGPDRQKIFSLILGDVSGIQTFLYSGATQRASRALKGRSFFLQYLTERLSHLIREHLNLSIFSEVFCGGGRFYLIASDKLEMDPLRSKIDNLLLELFGGALGLSLASTNFGADSLFNGELGMEDVFTRVNRELNSQKRRRFNLVALENHLAVFGPFGGDDECPICGHGMKKSKYPDDICSLCGFFIDLGSKLRKANYLLECQPLEQKNLQSLGVDLIPVSDLNNQKARENLSNVLRIIGLNMFDAEKMAQAGKKSIIGFPVLSSRIIGIRTPMEPADETITTFEKLAGDSNRLAILRADVDNLGELFRAEKQLPRLIALSRSISDFFEGRVTALLERDNFKNKTYLVYSGGDDLFVIGAWDSIIMFSQELQQEFTRFSSGRCTLSAGVEIVHPRLPIRRGAELAGIAEKKAKNLRLAKNSVCFLTVSAPWTDLLQVKGVVDLIVDVVALHHNRGLIGRLQDVAFAYQEYLQILKDAGKKNLDLLEAARWSRWRWLLVYGLRQEAPEDRKKILKAILNNGMQQYLSLIAGWADLATRRYEK